MPRIIFVNRYFAPDHSATSQILSDLAFELAAGGHDIHVVTSQQIYDDPLVRLPANEILHGVNVHRVPTTRFGRGRLIGRALDYLSFYWSMWQCLGSMTRPGDVLVTKTDPPLLSIFGALMAKRRSASFVNWLQDIYPEIAIELGVPLVRGPVGRLLTYLRDRSVRAADRNVVLGNAMATRLRTFGVADEQIAVIPNWTDDRGIVPVPTQDNPLRREWNLQNAFVVGYSGNLGRAHEFITLLDAAELLRDRTHFIFVFIGGGKHFDLLASEVRRRKLDERFRFFPYQSNDALKYSLSLPDVHWISLRPELEGLIFPSKFYGVAAAGRPIVAITGNDGDIAELVSQHACGFIVAPGAAAGLAQVLTRLADDPALCEEMGRRARAMLDAQFTRHQAIDRWKDLLSVLSQVDLQRIML